MQDLAAGAIGGLALVAVFGYLLGSIPFGVILTRLGGAGDVRSIGSGNIGATNVLRTGNKKIAALTLICDGLKGYFPVLAASLWGGEFAPLFAGFGALAGHIFPVWLKFKGGKGVATYIGVLLGLFWPAVLIFAGIWIAVAYFSRYSSLAALVATVAVPLALWGLGESLLAAIFAALTAIVWLKHRANIRRLLAGTEGRIGHRS